VAFLDDEPSKLRKRIYGVPVLGALDALDEVIASRHVDEVVIALPRSGGAVVRTIVDSCRLSGIPFRVMPGIYELLDGHFGISGRREVAIADLLGRPQVTPIEGAASYIAGGTVLITGAGGSIGGELARQVAHAGPKQLALLGHGENSIFDIASELRRRFPAVP